jgi:hypothetical protein
MPKLTKRGRRKSLVGWVEKEDYKKIIEYIRSFFYWNASKKRIEKDDKYICITIQEIPIHPETKNA